MGLTSLVVNVKRMLITDQFRIISVLVFRDTNPRKNIQTT